jgi:VWFA-related protein
MKTLVILLLLSASALTAQVTESIDVRVVNVDVTVMSKGVPVNGLTRDDFEVFEDGRRQTITNFYTSEETRNAAAPAPAGASVAGAAAAVPDPRFIRRVLVLVDNGHTTRRARDRALRQLETMINDRFHGDYEWSIGVIGMGVTLVLPMSSDKTAIHEALETIRRSGTRGEAASATFVGATSREGGLPRTPTALSDGHRDDNAYEERLEMATLRDDNERAIAAKFTVPAILDAVRGFAASSGRKIVFLLTGDPGLNDVDVVTSGGINGFRVRGVPDGKTVAGRDRTGDVWDAQNRILELRKMIVEEANASDVSFYIWNVQGLDAAWRSDSGVSPTGTNNSATFWLANQTGGRLMTSNDPAESVQQFDTASSSFYSLGYKPSHPDDGKYHSISVRVKRPGSYALAYRTGYSDNTSAIQLARAMKSPTAAAMYTNTLPIALEMGQPEPAGGDVTVPITIKIPFRSVQFLPSAKGVAANLVVYISAFNELGKNIVATSFPLTPGFKSGTPDLKGTLVYRNALKLKKGESDRVIVAVRDTITDSIGMATQVAKF